MNLDIFGKNKVADLKSEIALHGSTGTNTRAIDVATNGDTARKNACATKAKGRGSRQNGRRGPRYGIQKTTRRHAGRAQPVTFSLS